MANELNCSLPGQTGLTVTANTYLAGVLVTSGIACPEISGAGGLYSGNMTGSTAGRYAVEFLAGGVVRAAGAIDWDGTKEITNLNISVDTSGIAGEVIAGLGGANITLAAPVSIDGGTLTFTQGDDLYSAEYTAAVWSVTGTFPSVSGASGVLNMTVNGSRVSVSGLGLSLSGSTLTVTAQIPSASSGILFDGQGSFQVAITWASGHEFTYVQGTVNVIARV